MWARSRSSRKRLPTSAFSQYDHFLADGMVWSFPVALRGRTADFHASHKGTGYESPGRALRKRQCNSPRSKWAGGTAHLSGKLFRTQNSLSIGLDSTHQQLRDFEMEDWDGKEGNRELVIFGQKYLSTGSQFLVLRYNCIWLLFSFCLETGNQVQSRYVLLPQ